MKRKRVFQSSYVGSWCQEVGPWCQEVGSSDIRKRKRTRLTHPRCCTPEFVRPPLPPGLQSISPFTRKRKLHHMLTHETRRTRRTRKASRPNVPDFIVETQRRKMRRIGMSYDNVERQLVFYKQRQRFTHTTSRIKSIYESNQSNSNYRWINGILRGTENLRRKKKDAIFFY